MFVYVYFSLPTLLFDAEWQTMVGYICWLADWILTQAVRSCEEVGQLGSGEMKNKNKI